MTIRGPSRPSRVVQDPHALTGSSTRNYVLGLPYHTQGIGKGMVQQAYPKHRHHLQRVEWILCHKLYWRAET